MTAEIVLYCNSELVTGLIKKNGIFRITNFKPERYTINFNDDYSEVKGLDKMGDSWQCRDAYYNKKYSTVICSGPYNNGQSFTYHKDTNRFLSVDATVFGFIDRGNDTNGMTAGICKKF